MFEFLHIFTGLSLWSCIGVELAVCAIALSMTSRVMTYIRKLRQLLNRDRHVSPTDRLVVITGCDTGFGKATAQRLHDLGYVVFACCLDAEAASRMEAFAPRLTSPTFKVIQMDITDQQQVDGAVLEVRKWLAANKSQRMWSLVNNTGVMQPMVPTEFLALDSARRVFEVNYFGTLRVTNAFLPLLRQERGARIVVTASIAAEVPPVALNMASYTATKAAVLVAFDILRCEVRKFGVHVSAVCPDYYRTEIANPERNVKAFEAEWVKASSDLVDAYGGQAYGERVKAGIAGSVSMAKSDLSPAVDAFATAVSAVHPRRRYFPVSPGASWVKFLYKVSPLTVDNMCAQLNN